MTVMARISFLDGTGRAVLRVLGYEAQPDLLDAYLRGDCPDIRAHVRPAPNVPDTADALDVLDVIKGSPVHMALVDDEYG
jgi:putative hemolysin